MPHQYWRHFCIFDGSTSLSGSAAPCECGIPVVYDGWRGTRIEKMVANQSMAGLKLFGPHNELQSEVFKGATQSCTDCEGRGYFNAEGGSSYIVCEACHGAGYFSTLSTEERALRRAQVLAEFPEAAAPFGMAAFHRGDSK